LGPFRAPTWPMAGPSLKMTTMAWPSLSWPHPLGGGGSQEGGRLERTLIGPFFLQLTPHLSWFLLPLLFGWCAGGLHWPQKLVPPYGVMVPITCLDLVLFLLFYLSILVRASTQASVMESAPTSRRRPGPSCALPAPDL
jgi:hypothetical protein